MLANRWSRPSAATGDFFSAAEWRESSTYSLLKQAYLLNSRLISDLVEAADIDDPNKHKLRFNARQFVNAMSPANFAATNPDVLKAALESKGESVRAGFEPAPGR